MKKILFYSSILMILLLTALNVSASAPSSLIDKHVYRMNIGDTLSLNTSENNVTYNADSGGITVDESGTVTARSAGKFTVTASNGEASDSITVYVLEEPIKPLELTVRVPGVTAPADKPKISFLGDSITAGSHTDHRYYQFIEDKYHITPDGQGLSGSNIGGIGGSGQISFIDRVPNIANDTDMIFVLGGVNDFGQNAGDFKRFQIGVRVLIETLIDRFPDKMIVFSSPLRNGGYFSTSSNRYGNTLEEFVDEMKLACEEYDIPYFDSFRSEYFKDFYLYKEDGSFALTFDFQNPEYYGDGVHPNRNGHRVMAEWFVDAMQELEVITITDPLADWSFPYTDITPDSPYYEAVEYMGKRGIMNGVSENEFAPETILDRAMFVTILHRLENAPKINIQKFKDVKSGAYYSSAAAWANKEGIVTGVEPYVFAPELPITREQMAVMLYRYLGYKKLSQSEVGSTVSDSDISDWAKSAVDYCVDRGIIELKDGRFLPKEPVTRAEAAYSIMQICELQS
ncbi:MAG: S-layer homology domain-containing protein [Clostridia bacterium]|nr:S-layer homology domain-containing protein [Clostridia bacterium]